MSENVRSIDLYDGGSGTVLQLELTRAEWASAATKANVAAFLDDASSVCLGTELDAEDRARCWWSTAEWSIPARRRRLNTAPVAADVRRSWTSSSKTSPNNSAMGNVLMVRTASASTSTPTAMRDGGGLCRRQPIGPAQRPYRHRRARDASAS